MFTLVALELRVNKFIKDFNRCLEIKLCIHIETGNLYRLGYLSILLYLKSASVCYISLSCTSLI